MTDREHLEWLARTAQALSYDLDCVSADLIKTIRGEALRRKARPEDTSAYLHDDLVAMSDAEVREGIMASISETLRILRKYHDQDSMRRVGDVD